MTRSGFKTAQNRSKCAIKLDHSRNRISLKEYARNPEEREYFKNDEKPWGIYMGKRGISRPKNTHEDITRKLTCDRETKVIFLCQS